MPLVDYASSGEESEGENNESEVLEENREFLNKSTQKANINTSCKDNENNADSNATLFSSLPTPKFNFSLLTDNNKLSSLLLNKKIDLVKRQKNDKEGVKISVPSVSEFNESDQPPTKKRKPSTKGVGLFSVLPPPKNSSSKESVKTFVPHSIQKNFKKPSSKVTFNIQPTPGVPSTNNDGDDDDDTLVGSSFFGSSLSANSISSDSSTNDTMAPQINVTSETSNGQKMELTNVSSNWIAHNSEQSASDMMPSYEEETSSLSNENSQDGSETIPEEDNPLALDEKALQILCGNKKKRQQMSMNIIDLSGEEIMPDSKEWLLKQFTEEKRGRSHSHRKHDGPSSQSRRKHQITYLAFQAKEQELELQNQWANNRMSRRQTQSKYGF